MFHQQKETMAKAQRSGGSSLKDQFDQLSLDDKATFLVQATFSTAAATIDEIGRRISEIVDTLADDVEEAPDVEPGATAPPKSSSSSSGARAKKSTSTGSKKSTTTKKSTSTRKRPPKPDTPDA